MAHVEKVFEILEFEISTRAQIIKCLPQKHREVVEANA
jgi:hypothetical protein